MNRSIMRIMFSQFNTIEQVMHSLYLAAYDISMTSTTKYEIDKETSDATTHTYLKKLVTTTTTTTRRIEF